MCGIYATNIPFSEDEVKLKLESIKFRGPDHTGIKKIDDIVLGHLRLSIIDLDARSHQPFNYEGLSIVFNGEIYNFQDIKTELITLGYSFTTSGDTEVLLAGYKEWGKDIVHKLNGMFAFVIYDTIAKKIFCSRDRLGVKPFYYSWQEGKFEICSQLRPISQHKKINEEAISIFLDCTYIPSPHTIFQNVYKLPPGNNLEIDLHTQQISIYEYWNLKPINKLEISYEEATSQLHDLLKDAIKIRLQADVPFGSFLSGGIDSALISSIAAQVSPDSIKTFSIGFEDPEFDESKIAAQYASIIGSVHTETLCTTQQVLEMIPKLVSVYDEPFGDSSALPSLLLNKVTKQHVTVALSGDGGDESFLGYNHFDWVTKFTKLIRIPFVIRWLTSKALVLNILGKRTEPIKRILNLKTANSFIEGIFVGYNTILEKRNLNWLKTYNSYQKLSRNVHQKTADLNIKLWLENDSNVKVDRASMAYSMEVRSPFLDYRIIEFARNLSVSFRYMPGRKKRILRDILKEYIPEQVFNQPKKGFAIPIGAWMRNELKEEFVTNLSDRFLYQVPNLNVPKFKKMFQEHLKGKSDYSSYIWRVYVLSKWCQEFGYFQESNAQPKSKIFFIIPTLQAGGAEHIISFIAQNIDKTKFSVKLIVLGYEKDNLYDVKDVDVIYCNKKRLTHAIPKLFKLIYKNNPAIVFGTIGHVNLTLGFLSLFFKKTKFIGRVSTLISKIGYFSKEKQINKRIKKFLYNRLHAIICQSSDMKADFESFLNTHSSKLTVINNPITSTENIIKTESSFKGFKFITVGRLSPEKGHIRILNCLAKIKSYDFKYTIIGSGPLESLIKEKVSELGLEKNVDYIPYTNQVLNIVNAHDYFIQGSYFEGFPNALLESCTTGTPVLAFNAPGGTKEIVQDGVNGFLVETEFELIEVLNNINKLTSIESNNVKSSVSSKFDSKKILKEYESIFQKLLNN